MALHSSTLDRAFQALADPTRRAVIGRLAQGEASISELAAPFDMALPSFLKHVRSLEDGGLIRSRKIGRVRTASLSPVAFAALEAWLAEQRAVWEARTDRLEQFVLTQNRELPE